MAVNLIKKFSENKEKFAFGSIIAIAISAIVALSTVRANKVDEEANRAKEEYYRKQLESTVDVVESKTDNIEVPGIIVTTAPKKEIVSTEQNETTTSEETSLTETTEPEKVGPVPLMEPYDGHLHSIADCTVGGVKYKNNTSLRAVVDAFAAYNLGGKYSSLTFDMGHEDGTSTGDFSEGSYVIYLDGVEERQIDLTADQLSVPVELNVKNVKQVLVKCVDGNVNVNARYAIVNGTLYP